MNVHIPSTREIYMIAYLVSHGWELSYKDFWTKPGFKHEIRDDLDRLVDCEEFGLNDAYWAQKSALESK
ncbi:MAG TPA: hypothetical protein VM577_00650 [Anaerovoracaceae bacterium]|nr:hypothetical protein [Anaerovoracaceae bacterium]